MDLWYISADFTVENLTGRNECFLVHFYSSFHNDLNIMYITDAIRNHTFQYINHNMHVVHSNRLINQFLNRSLEERKQKRQWQGDLIRRSSLDDFHLK